jgi:MFS family permease
MASWITQLTQAERRTMIGCFGGWTLDALDVQVYSFALPTILTMWNISRGQAGVLGTSVLLLSAFGGWFAGAMCDRYGRVRVLQFTIICYAIFTFLSGFAQNFEQLFLFRGLQGLGFGGEWAAGAVLMGEVIRDKFRGRAGGLVQSGWAVGWGAAALLYIGIFAVLPDWLAWRALFWIGIIPAVLVLWLRRHVKEPTLFVANRHPTEGLFKQLFSMLQPAYLSTTLKLVLLVTGAQGGSFGLSVWLPTYLKTVRGLSVANTGEFLLVHIFGAFCGFICGAYLTDRLGRKPTIAVSVIGAAALMPIYLLLPLGPTALMLLGAPLGFFVYFNFSAMGPFMTELFPTAVRATAQGFCYNAGRAVGAFFPLLVGVLSETMTLAQALVLFCIIAWALMGIALLMLPETRGVSLTALDAEHDESSSVITGAAQPLTGHHHG